MSYKKVFTSAADPNSLKDVAHVKNQSADDVVLEKIGQIIIANKAERRFGVALLHKHFDVAGDEKIVEEFKPDERTLVISVKKDSDLTQPVIPSVFKFTK